MHGAFACLIEDQESIAFFHNDKNVTVDDVRRAVEIELAGSESNSDTEPCTRKSDSCMSSMYHEILCMM